MDLKGNMFYSREMLLLTEVFPLKRKPHREVSQCKIRSLGSSDWHEICERWMGDFTRHHSDAITVEAINSPIGNPVHSQQLSYIKYLVLREPETMRIHVWTYNCWDSQIYGAHRRPMSAKCDVKWPMKECLICWFHVFITFKPVSRTLSQAKPSGTWKVELFWMIFKVSVWICSISIGLDIKVKKKKTTGRNGTQRDTTLN